MYRHLVYWLAAVGVFGRCGRLVPNVKSPLQVPLGGMSYSAGITSPMKTFRPAIAGKTVASQELFARSQQRNPSTNGPASSLPIRGLAALTTSALSGRQQRTAMVRRAAGGWTTATVDAATPISKLLEFLPATLASGGSSFAILLVPRAKAADLPAMAKSVENRLGASVPVLAVLSGGSGLSLAVATGIAPSLAISLAPATLSQDLDLLMAAAPTAQTLLLFGDAAAPESFVRQALSELDTRLPQAVKVGALAAPPEVKTLSAISLNGASGAGKIIGVVLQDVRCALDVCDYEAFGPRLEVFDAALPRQGPTIIQKIGTEEEGSVEDAEETEKGTAGIARRVSVPAAAAVQGAMKAAGVSGPKEVFIGIPGSSKSGLTPQATANGDSENWALFPWAGMTKEGGVVLGGRGPVAEGLCPKLSLAWARCFRSVVPSAGAASQLAQAAAGGGGLVISTAGSPAQGVKAMAEKGGPSVLTLIGTAVLGTASGTTSAGIHSRAVATVAAS